MSETPKIIALELVFSNGKRFYIGGGTIDMLEGDAGYADLLAAEAQGKLISHRLHIQIHERERGDQPTR
jgi:hypothetical protein